ncbi:type III pantothenate kinase [candidate division KSB1 bacterium]|nr:type III pantothenate kinase [candidate division KSB1 bacterium]
MLLAIDIGNTNIVLGLFQDGDLAAHWRISSSTSRTSDECWLVLTQLMDQHDLSISDIEGVIICSVVPNITPAFTRMAEEKLRTEAIIITADLDFGLINRYSDPHAVGADRLVNAVAGYARYGGPLIIIDFGTATTFDVVSKNKEYLGGIIAPGVESSAMVLHRNAARLPKVEMKFPDLLIGNSTESSIQSGIMYGTVEMIDGMVQRIMEELGPDTRTVATGGLANVIVPYCRTVHDFNPMLTLDGLNMIYEKIKKGVIRTE